jgi:hypothetical protein
VLPEFAVVVIASFLNEFGQLERGEPDCVMARESALVAR